MFANPRHDPIDGDLDLNAHRAFRQRQHLGNLTRRQPFLPIEQEYRAAAFGKVIDETSHQLFYFRFNQAAIRRICIVGGGNCGLSPRRESLRATNIVAAPGTPSGNGSIHCGRRHRDRLRRCRSAAMRHAISRSRRRRCSRPHRTPSCCAENSRRTGKRSGNRDHRKPEKLNHHSRSQK